jgi:GNAT superfamily N-acetyltransferase
MNASLGIIWLLGTASRRETAEATGGSFRVRSLDDDDAPHLVEAFADHGWRKPLDLFIRYAAEQRRGLRLCYVAESADSLAGYCTLLWESKYEPFRTAGIPEITDLNVLPPHRGHGVGNALLDVIETGARERSQAVGLGVGLYADYGAAQRIYARRGYVPDGKGVMYRNRPVPPGCTVRLDDDAALMLTLTFPSRMADGG